MVRVGHEATERELSQPFKLTLSNHRGVQYTAPVSLSNQELQAIYDTGSFEVMAIAKQCSVCKMHPTLHTYDSSSSTTFRSGDRGIEAHHFAGGTVKARQDYETVQIGGPGSVLQADDMAFWQVVDTSMPIFLNGQSTFAAIVGLGHRSSPPDDPTSDSLIERTGVQKFSICLLPGLANPGYLTFNPAHNLADPAFQKVAVVGKNHWAVNMNSVTTTLNGVPVRSCYEIGGQKSCVAIVDSGTSLIGVPSDAAPMINMLIKKIRYDCSNLDELPDLVFELDGKRFALPARSYTVHFEMKNGKPNRCLPAFTDIAMALNGANVWILGLPFLRHFYTVFDRWEPSIYIANQDANCEPAIANNGNFLNTSGFTSGADREQHLPTIADLSQARLPSWALGKKDVSL